MSRVTLKAVNEAIAKAGGSERLYKAKDYFYFGDGNSATWHTTSIMVAHLSQLTVREWFAEWQRMRCDAECDFGEGIK